MPITTKILYGAWCLLPATYLFLGIWSLLEAKSKPQSRQNPGDYFKQVLFLTICVAVAVGLDQYLIKDYAPKYSPEFIPYGFYQFMSFPVTLVIGARVFGGSKEVRIANPDLQYQLSKKKQKSKRKR